MCSVSELSDSGFYTDAKWFASFPVHVHSIVYCLCLSLPFHFSMVPAGLSLFFFRAIVRFLHFLDSISSIAFSAHFCLVSSGTSSVSCADAGKKNAHTHSHSQRGYNHLLDKSGFLLRLNETVCSCVDMKHKNYCSTNRYVNEDRRVCMTSGNSLLLFGIECVSECECERVCGE